MRARMVLATLLVVTAARADGAIQHTVKKGDTCASIAQQYYGDSRLVDPLFHQLGLVALQRQAIGAIHRFSGLTGRGDRQVAVPLRREHQHGVDVGPLR